VGAGGGRRVAGGGTSGRTAERARGTGRRGYIRIAVVVMVVREMGTRPARCESSSGKLRVTREPQEQANTKKACGKTRERER
jgi:hypothetical protein